MPTSVTGVKWHVVEESPRAECRFTPEEGGEKEDEHGELTFDRRNTHAVWGRVHKCHRVEARVGLMLALATPVKRHPPPDAARDFGAPRAPTPRAEGLFNPRRGIHASRPTVVPSLIAYDVDSLSKIRLDYERGRRGKILSSSRFGYSDIHRGYSSLVDPCAKRNLRKFHRDEI